MRKIVVTACLALGVTLGIAEVNTAQADHGPGGYRAQSWNYGPSRGGYYGGRYAPYGVPYGRYYRAPVVVGPGFYYPQGIYSGYGRSSFYGGNYGNMYAPGFGGGYGNLGYPSPFGPRTLPRVQLRIGF